MEQTVIRTGIGPAVALLDAALRRSRGDIDEIAAAVGSPQLLADSFSELAIAMCRSAGLDRNLSQTLRIRERTTSRGTMRDWTLSFAERRLPLNRTVRNARRISGQLLDAVAFAAANFDEDNDDPQPPTRVRVHLPDRAGHTVDSRRRWVRALAYVLAEYAEWVATLNDCSLDDVVRGYRARAAQLA